MGVPIDRGLTLSVAHLITLDPVEMGVPIDRGLTHQQGDVRQIGLLTIEMGVPIDRGLTQII